MLRCDSSFPVTAGFVVGLVSVACVAAARKREDLVVRIAFGCTVVTAVFRCTGETDSMVSDWRDVAGPLLDVRTLEVDRC
uniref:Putative secreted protein n=1 Tax=Anopheles darlingi TaxID=43151 RepID=A0A2M4DJX0_ANODA